jgi:hypothetical protein
MQLVIITTVFLGEQSYRFAPIDFNRWTKKKDITGAGTQNNFF